MVHAPWLHFIWILPSCIPIWKVLVAEIDWYRGISVNFLPYCITSFFQMDHKIIEIFPFGTGWRFWSRSKMSDLIPSITSILQSMTCQTPACYLKSWAREQSMNKCQSDSVLLQKGHSVVHWTLLVTTLLQVGRQSLKNLHMKCFIFGGTTSFQISS